MDLNSDATTFQPTNASYYRRELKKAQAEIAELKRKLFKAEIERGVMFEEYDKLRAIVEKPTITHDEWYAKCNEVEELRAKLDAWEKQSPVAWANESMMNSTEFKVVLFGKPTHSVPLFTKPKEQT